MTEPADSTPITEAQFIDVPRDADLKALHQYWDSKRDGRLMPRRADIEPAEIPKLLPHIIMYNVLRNGGGYTNRLVGGEIVNFAGRNGTGEPAGSCMPPRAAAMMTGILDAVTVERTPKFRAGKAHWHPDKAYREFEACFLPLSSDGDTVDVILGAIKFPLAGL